MVRWASLGFFAVCLVESARTEIGRSGKAGSLQDRMLDDGLAAH